jgi:hypothetical protein
MMIIDDFSYLNMTQIRPSADYRLGSDFLVPANRALPLLTRSGICAELSIFTSGK